MLLSISLILIVGMSIGWLCQKWRLPSLLGMLATGMVLGPYVLNLLDGSIPLARGFACGDTVLTVAVLAIVLTAPLGAFAIDLSYKKLLKIM